MEKQHHRLSYLTIDSDHNLLIADMRIKLSCPKRGKKGPKYDTDILKNFDIQQKYCVEIRNRFQLFTDTERTQDELWNDMKFAIHETACKILEKSKTKPKKPWISFDTFTLIDRKRLLRQQRLTSEVADKDYKASKRAAQLSIRTDKNKWLEEQCLHLEELIATNNSIYFFQIAE